MSKWHNEQLTINSVYTHIPYLICDSLWSFFGQVDGAEILQDSFFNFKEQFVCLLLMDDSRFKSLYLDSTDMSRNWQNAF